MNTNIEGASAFFGVFPIALQVGMTVVAAASTVTALTPTPRDDAMVGKLYKVLEILALNIGHAKDAPPNRLGGRFVAE